MTGIKEQQDHPLAPDRPLAPITWRQAPAEPHGYYDRKNYARGWNDAVSVVTAQITAMREYAEGLEHSLAMLNQQMEEKPTGEILFQVWVSAQPSYWREAQIDEYSAARKDERRIIHIIGE